MAKGVKINPSPGRDFLSVFGSPHLTQGLASASTLNKMFKVVIS